jgi:hypothetical protein
LAGGLAAVFLFGKAGRTVAGPELLRVVVSDGIAMLFSKIDMAVQIITAVILGKALFTVPISITALFLFIFASLIST